MIRVSDYIAKRLAQLGLRHVFMLTGGGAMFLNDSLGHSEGLTVTFNHHEQACAIAAESYARITGIPAIVNVTSGPGGINALNGVFGAWTDSIPMIIISGQVKRETNLRTYKLSNLRQLGDQEADIIKMVEGITKYAVMVDDPNTIRFHVEKAVSMSMEGRPGPCWLDIPVDVQSSLVHEEELQGYKPLSKETELDRARLANICRDVIGRITKSSRPVLMVGTGVRRSKAIDIFEKVKNSLGIPVVPSWSAIDSLPSDDPFFCGRPGTLGDRAGNFTVQNSDTLLIVGSRLNIRQVSYNWTSFARHAFKIQVDIDEEELNKPTIKPDLPICCDARLFFEVLDQQLDDMAYDKSIHRGWLEWCKQRVASYPVVQAKHRKYNGCINPYHFLDELIKRLDSDDVIVCGDGTACVVPIQVAQIKRGQRLICNSGNASMGYDLPAAIGTSVAQDGGRVICLAGDGSIQLNIQELQTIAHNQLPIKIFVLNNNGYLSIRQTQKNFFGRFTGESIESGISFPDIVNIARAYGITAIRINEEEFTSMIDDVLGQPRLTLCEVMLDRDQPFEPRLTSKQLPDGRIVSPPLEDMYPFLSREELLNNLLIPQMEY